MSNRPVAAYPGVIPGGAMKPAERWGPVSGIEDGALAGRVILDGEPFSEIRPANAPYAGKCEGRSQSCCGQSEVRRDELWSFTLR
jgi:hypothetical protein